MVGGGLSGTLYRVCGNTRGNRTVGDGRRRFHRPRRFYLCRPARTVRNARGSGRATQGRGTSPMKLRRPILAVAIVLAAFPVLAQGPKAKPKAAAPAQSALPTPTSPDADLAFGAFQRGYYLTAFAEATKRVEKSDAKAMTLLAELYANGFGIGQDDRKAVEWYQLAADRGDREAMFALAMFRLTGRGGPRNRDDTARLLAASARLGHPAANYDLALLYLEGQQFPQDFVRAAELFRNAANAGNPEAQYALGTLYKEGRGVAKDAREAARLFAAAALADNLDAQTEYAIMLFNGEGVAKDEAGGGTPVLTA